MHPVTYFIEDSTINLLTQRFGCYLEQLDRSQIIQVRVLLTNFLMGQEMMGEHYTICDAWQDSSLHLLVQDEAVVEVADILDGLTIAQAEGLLSAFQEQCTVGNARLKTSVETTTDDLIKHGVPHELARAGAIILREVDGQRSRTPEEQEIINQVFQLTTKEAA
ncbi:hypothetical protein [Brasilonema bromeliae]|uniref:Uncharacterized protein n=1 Tax=Brasilonema bromeliae SPC951 TaxID=385972 RepID=A0ABX1P8N4_9CYAN|nr:hypothetical protein [Brasilonema bromeliae]NMG20706.1 hypothetical protein [Brasilonema bromeliae SPC951]